eukprot:TRINITY_DN5978_c0_g1_i8.p1 TRINITY_DN5978_c0_g1~~TRINITY_DN5978_c0_g1_i8.p1  ORF type:complete len:119 (-),score=41.83 TRINITY_DN5978_c0_g1_i8:4-360(-)
MCIRDRCYTLQENEERQSNEKENQEKSLKEQIDEQADEEDDTQKEEKDEAAEEPEAPFKGEHSVFKIAAHYGWQGLVHLILSNGFDFLKAFSEALEQNKLHLATLIFKKVLYLSLIHI